ncbi:PTS sugar transporter subunit IIA [Virgibacillus sp. NKC19-3]|uniref:PTS sugar transporter subunit IIA n=1 Tax=Virgibacillus saliphilus TaxID=2831674 RepID=UPI001C9AE6E7|nr:PTS sugar transporter subunit IIA [Virgibacillus sp. NKC19-3]MBY7142868.1 PTS sugar transporter subunit IIA [Virgibacillus sp. NKC19-3]
MNEIKSLFNKELIFIESAESQSDIFTYIGNVLIEKGKVKPDFVKAIKEREKNYPTGLDLSPVSNDIPNAAIPHTETEYCKSKHIVFVKLNEGVRWNNMIAPEQEMEVKYLFFIINDEKDNQTNVLSEIMTFVTDASKLKSLESMNSENEIYQFLVGQKNKKLKGAVTND